MEATMLTTLVTILLTGALFVEHSVRISRAEKFVSREFLITQASLWAVAFPMLLGVHFRSDWHPAEALFAKSLWDPVEWIIALFAWIVYGFATAAVAQLLSAKFEPSGESMQNQNLNQLVREASALLRQLNASIQKIEMSVVTDTVEVDAGTLSILSLQIQTALRDAGLLEHGLPSERASIIRGSAEEAVRWWESQCRQDGIELSRAVQTVVCNELIAMWSSIRSGLPPSPDEFCRMMDNITRQIQTRSRKNPSDDSQTN